MSKELEVLEDLYSRAFKSEHNPTEQKIISYNWLKVKLALTPSTSEDVLNSLKEKLQRYLALDKDIILKNNQNWKEWATLRMELLLEIGVEKE